MAQTLLPWSTIPRVNFEISLRLSADLFIWFLGITHVVRHAADLNIDPQNIILSGDSFGSQMALSMAFTNGNLFKKVSINNPPAQNVLLNLPSHQNNKYFMISDIGSAWYWSNLINGANSQKVTYSPIHWASELSRFPDRTSNVLFSIENI